ncbi:MAG: hypothetical protein ACXVMS_09205 [Flavisolibacter sp.]
MRKILLILLFFPCSFWGNAQYLTDSVNLKTFLFEKFIAGKVLLKSGVVQQALLNYNTEDQSMVFIQNKQYMHFADLDAIDTIYVQQQKFIAVDNAICAVVHPASPVSLLMSFSNKVHPNQATTDHNGTSIQSSNQVSNTVSDVYMNRIYKGNYSVQFLKQYCLARGGKLYRVNHKKRFLEPFPSRTRKTLENYIDKNSLDLTNETDLVKLVDFCNQELSRNK